MNEPLPTLRLLRDQIFGLYAVVPAEQVEAVRRRLIDIGAPFGLDAEGADRLRRPDSGTFLFGAGAGDALRCLKAADIAYAVEPGWVLDAQSYGPPVDRLLLLGDKNPPFFEGEALVVPDGEDPWEGGLPPIDYAVLGLAREHLPELLRLASNPEWCHATGDAPLHAVRAIAAVGGDEAPEALLRLLRATEGEDWDWLRDEVKRALWKSKPQAIGPLGDFAGDEANGVLSRIAVIEAMSRIARNHPAIRAVCIERLTGVLAQYAVQAPELNGFLVAALVELGAKAAAPLIERAFAAGRVDETINGDWEDAQIDLGLKLRRERAPKPNRLTELGRQFREKMGIPEPLEDEFGNRLEAPYDPLALLAPEAQPKGKVGRNDPCPCGSGKKFKKCCGA